MHPNFSRFFYNLFTRSGFLTLELRFACLYIYSYFVNQKTCKGFEDKEVISKKYR